MAIDNKRCLDLPGCYMQFFSGTGRKDEDVKGVSLSDSLISLQGQDVGAVCVAKRCRIAGDIDQPSPLFAALRHSRERDLFVECFSVDRKLNGMFAAGADPNAQEHGRSLLMQAVIDGNSAAVRVILSRGGDIDATSLTDQGRDSTPLVYALSIRGPARAERQRASVDMMAELLIEQGANVCKAGCTDGDAQPRLPIEVAVANDSYELTQLLVSRGALMPRTPGESLSYTPAMWTGLLDEAVSLGLSNPSPNTELARLLVTSGARVTAAHREHVRMELARLAPSLSFGRRIAAPGDVTTRQGLVLQQYESMLASATAPVTSHHTTPGPLASATNLPHRTATQALASGMPPVTPSVMPARTSADENGKRATTRPIFAMEPSAFTFRAAGQAAAVIGVHRSGPGAMPQSPSGDVSDDADDDVSDDSDDDDRDHGVGTGRFSWLPVTGDGRGRLVNRGRIPTPSGQHYSATADVEEPQQTPLPPSIAAVGAHLLPPPPTAPEQWTPAPPPSCAAGTTDASGVVDATAAALAATDEAITSGDMTPLRPKKSFLADVPGSGFSTPVGTPCRPHNGSGSHRVGSLAETSSLPSPVRPGKGAGGVSVGVAAPISEQGASGGVSLRPSLGLSPRLQLVTPDKPSQLPRASFLSPGLGDVTPSTGGRDDERVPLGGFGPGAGGRRGDRRGGLALRTSVHAVGTAEAAVSFLQKVGYFFVIPFQGIHAWIPAPYLC
eukprot:jgi/Mesvir1/5239/Mv15361-RA.2